jgi:hypothetical protein
VWPDASVVVLRRAIFIYVFGQQLHFTTWLRLVPEADRPSPLPHSFARAVAALRTDLRSWAGPALAAAALGVVALLAGGALARETYFALTYFHVGLEAAALTRAVAVLPFAALREVV